MDVFWKDVLTMLVKCAGSSQFHNLNEYIKHEIKSLCWVSCFSHLCFYWCCQQVRNLLARKKLSLSIRKPHLNSIETLGTLGGNKALDYK